MLLRVLSTSKFPVLSVTLLEVASPLCSGSSLWRRQVLESIFQLSWIFLKQLFLMNIFVPVLQQILYLSCLMWVIWGTMICRTSWPWWPSRLHDCFFFCLCSTGVQSQYMVVPSCDCLQSSVFSFFLNQAMSRRISNHSCSLLWIDLTNKRLLLLFRWVFRFPLQRCITKFQVALAAPPSFC